MYYEIGAKCNKSHNTEIRNGSQGSVDYVLWVGMGHKCNKGGSCINQGMSKKYYK